MAGNVALGLFVVLWYGFMMVQMFLSYGTAYRFTKRGGDNGVALYGWLIVFGLASTIPGLGLYLWLKNRDINQPQNYTNQ